MSLAAETRRAVSTHPFLLAALRADIVNYTAAARFLAVDGETDAVATALRRFGADLEAYQTETYDVRVTMQSGLGAVEEPADALLIVGDCILGDCDGGDQTAILATGGVDTHLLATALERLTIAGIEPTAAAVGEDCLVVVVPRLEGATTLRVIEQTLEAVPVTQPLE